MNDTSSRMQAPDANGPDGPAAPTERKGFDEPKVEQQGDLPVITALVSYVNGTVT